MPNVSHKKPVTQRAKLERPIDARIVYDFLKARQWYVNWVKDYIVLFDFREGKDWERLKIKNTKTGPSYKTSYMITVDFAFHLLMSSRTARGIKARQVFLKNIDKDVIQKLVTTILKKGGTKW